MSNALSKCVNKYVPDPSIKGSVFRVIKRLHHKYDDAKMLSWAKITYSSHSKPLRIMKYSLWELKVPTLRLCRHMGRHTIKPKLSEYHDMYNRHDYMLKHTYQNQIMSSYKPWKYRKSS